ncbi:NAD-dependent epimerase/dehydratase family protein [Arcanobacterium ihumii]|uniref:NAD-dependent epimerase/dehydratase family protein n=1 Tax=Arcanobacterium ihumii TaxID=2138162 RepID=UPI000F5284B6|nr:NAD-dependent epimerase/dehydratase family protein [Arcanobacterium ihumii]
MDNESFILVVGAGGLLGRALVKSARNQNKKLVIARNLPWNNSSQVLEKLNTILSNAFADQRNSASHTPNTGIPESLNKAWTLIWCAGAGTTGTTAADLNKETELFHDFIELLHHNFSAQLKDLTFFYASSAGGLYAGSSNPPFTEQTPPAPLAPYGFAKLACENAVSSLTNDGATVAIGRIANLYGPGQDISKPQGLVSQLCLSYHKGTFNKIFVSLDTLRDYIYTDDAATLIFRFIEAAHHNAPGKKSIKIIGSGYSLSIAELIGVAKAIFKRKLPYLQVVSNQTSVQARDLRLQSTVFLEVDAIELTTFPSGFFRTNQDIGTRFRLNQTNLKR